MKIAISLLVVSLTISLIGCSSNGKAKSTVTNYETLFVDSAFPKHQTYIIETEDEVFALDEEMKEFVQTKLRNIQEPNRRINKLVKYLFSRDYIDLSYHSNANLTASQAFHSKSANCLSLTIMAYSLAQYAEMDVEFKHVDVPEYWMRNGNYNTLAGHVNIQVKVKKAPNTPILFLTQARIIDFDPSINAQNFDSFDIDKAAILAMFYNNKGANAMVNGQYDLAYAYFKAAVKINPSFSSAWGNLGILYKFNNMLNQAKGVYNYALFLDEENYTVFRNLAITLAALGDIGEAKNIMTSIHQKRLKNPYYLVMLGNEAFYESKFENAVSYYRRALKMEPRLHESYFGLTKAYYALGDVHRAEQSIEKAVRLIGQGPSNQEYTAKLNFIRQRH